MMSIAKCKKRLREEIELTAKFSSHTSRFMLLSDALRKMRAFCAELIADSVLECLSDADKYPTVEVDEITSQEWLDSYQYCDRSVDWLYERTY